MTDDRAFPSSAADIGVILDSISEVFYVLDAEGRFVTFNRAAETFFATERGQILGQRLWDVFPQGRGTEFEVAIETAMTTRQSSRRTHRSITWPGKTVSTRVAPLNGGGVCVSVDDVTEQAEAEQALRASRERLDLAASAYSIGIFDLHLESGQLIWTREQEAVFGLAPGMFEGHADDFRRRVVPEDFDRLQAETDAAVAAGQRVMRYGFRINRADGAVRWIDGAARLMPNADGMVDRMVGVNVDVTDRKVSEQHQRLLLNELNHRVKNTLSIVQGIAWQSFRAGGVAREAREAFEGRLTALSAAHNVLTQHNWESATIGDILRVATAPQATGDGRLTTSGPDVELEPKTAVALGLAAHELATNAVKYGALSTPYGRVEIRWTVDGGLLRLTWQEHGGPPVTAPTRRGFGSRLLEQGLSEELRGKVRLDFAPTGLTCTVEADLGG